MTEHSDIEDELVRRFKLLFNKEPVSQSQTESPWKIEGHDNYDFDDEEVSSSALFFDTLLIES